MIVKKFIDVTDSVLKYQKEERENFFSIYKRYTKSPMEFEQFKFAKIFFECAKDKFSDWNENM